jgi:hypothetical protein
MSTSQSPKPWPEMEIRVPPGMGEAEFLEFVGAEVERLVDDCFMRLFGETRAEAERRYQRILGQAPRCGAI